MAMNFKSLAGLAAVLVAGMTFADNVTVLIGITKVESPYKNTIVAVPYYGFEQGQYITVSNVVKTANLENGDLCYAMSGSDNLYNAWVLATVDGVKQWQSTTQVRMTSDGTTTVTTSPTPSTTYLAPGSAIWIVRNGDSRDYNTQPFYLWGRYEGTVPTTTVTASSSGTWNLVANAGQKAMTVSAIITAIGESNWVEGDRITVPQNNGTEIGFLRGSSRWFPTDTASVTIQPGMGCWIFKKTNGGTISWPTSAD